MYEQQKIKKGENNRTFIKTGHYQLRVVISWAVALSAQPIFRVVYV